MIRPIIIVMLVALAFPAFAQQQASPTEQALGARLMQEIQGSLVCGASLITVQADLAKAQARIKELEPTEKPARPK
jgi:hypothetical protein